MGVRSRPARSTVVMWHQQQGLVTFGPAGSKKDLFAMDKPLICGPISTQSTLVLKSQHLELKIKRMNLKQRRNGLPSAVVSLALLTHPSQFGIKITNFSK